MIFLPHVLIILIAHLSGELRKKALVVPHPLMLMNQND